MAGPVPYPRPPIEAYTGRTDRPVPPHHSTIPAMYFRLHTEMPAEPEAPSPSGRWATVTQMTVGQLRDEFNRYSFHMPNVRVSLDIGGRDLDSPVCDSRWDGTRWARPPVAIRVAIDTADSRKRYAPGERVTVSGMTITAVQAVPLLPAADLRAGLAILIRQAIDYALMHEVAEWLRYDGALVDDPHIHERARDLDD
jgi:hypothetical protein